MQQTQTIPVRVTLRELVELVDRRITAGEFKDEKYRIDALRVILDEVRLSNTDQLFLMARGLNNLVSNYYGGLRGGASQEDVGVGVGQETASEVESGPAPITRIHRKDLIKLVAARRALDIPYDGLSPMRVWEKAEWEAFVAEKFVTGKTSIAQARFGKKVLKKLAETGRPTIARMTRKDSDPIDDEADELWSR